MPLLEASQRTDAWHEARAGKITASLAAACLGLHPHSSRMAAWREITGRGGPSDNAFMAWGRQNEAEARRCYEAETGLLVRETGFWVHPKLPWLGASPDGLVGQSGQLEVKCPTLLPGSVPIHHRIQVLVQLACTGRSWCDYFAWTPEASFLRRIYPAGTAGLLRRLEGFYRQFVLTDIEPPSKRAKLSPGSTAWLEYLAKLPDRDLLNSWLPQLSEMDEKGKRQAWKFVNGYASGRGWSFDAGRKAFVAPVDTPVSTGEEVVVA